LAPVQSGTDPERVQLPQQRESRPIEQKRFRNRHGIADDDVGAVAGSNSEPSPAPGPKANLHPPPGHKSHFGDIRNKGGSVKVGVLLVSYV